MENSGLGSGLFTGMGSGLLALEMPLHQQQSPQNAQNPHHLHHPQMVAYAHHDPDQSQQSVKHPFAFASSKPKQLSPLSDEDEPGFTGDDITSDGKRKISPWQRMKWTDSMVRLLIMAVFYIGDEAVCEGNDPKKKAGGLAQKKGKWKSVSRAMMEKGFYVSPQQCEDKFNDLNKRYKRVNDILGKGTACRVVENQSLLETMDLTPKLKEEARKLLNSKHLFFREMCAYHNSCGHGPTAVASGTGHSPEMATDRPQAQVHQQQQAIQQQQHKCSHSSENAHTAANSRSEMEGPRAGKTARNDEDDEEYDDESDDDDEDDEDDDEAVDGSLRGRDSHAHGHDDEEYHDEKSLHKRYRTVGGLSSPPPPSSVMQQLNGELTGLVQDGAKSSWEKKQWMNVRLLQLEEQQVRYQMQAFELEKQRLKWAKFSSKKEREMERAKLENERRRLENERMVLLIRQRELELLDLQHHNHQHHHHQQQLSSNKRSDPSSISG